MPIFGYYDHVIDPDTGRPLPHDSWQREGWLIRIGLAGAAVLIALAAWQALRGDGLDEALRLLGGAALFAPLVGWRHFELEARRKAWREALADYEAAVTALAPPDNPD